MNRRESLSFVVVSETLRALGRDSSEAATLSRRLANDSADPDTISRIALDFVEANRVGGIGVEVWSAIRRVSGHATDRDEVHLDFAEERSFSPAVRWFTETYRALTPEEVLELRNPVTFSFLETGGLSPGEAVTKASSYSFDARQEYVRRLEIGTRLYRLLQIAKGRPEPSAAEQLRAFRSGKEGATDAALVADARRAAAGGEPIENALRRLLVAEQPGMRSIIESIPTFDSPGT